MPHYNKSQWVERDDHQPGWIYLLEAKDFHGIVPGCYLKRCKIGLTRSVENRLATLHSSQPPCDYKVVKAVYVQDMAAIEDALHARFKHCNIKLEKSREWFDLNPWQYQMVLWAFSRYESHRIRFEGVPVRLVAGGLVALLVLGMLIGLSMREPQVQPSVEAIREQR